MIRKLLVRLFIACFVFVGTFAATMAIAGYLAMQPPKFYAELLAVEAADEQATDRFLDKTEAEFQLWVSRSLALQRAGGDYDRMQDVFEIRITEQQINAQLEAKLGGLNNELQSPRLRVLEDQIALAFKVALPGVECVFSSTLRPSVTAGGELRLEVQDASVGQLPLPLSLMLGCVPQEVDLSSGDVAVDLASSIPSVTLALPRHDSDAATVKSLRCTPGEIILELVPPMLPGQPDDQLAATVL